MASLKLLPATLALLGLAGCAELGLVVPGDAPVTPVAAAQPVVDDAAARAAKLPKQALTPSMLFQFLVAEVAGQRGQLGLSKATYLELARQTRDPRVAGRATEIAVFARDQESALSAAEIWLEAEPDSERARHTVVALRLGRGEFELAEPPLRAMLANEPGPVFMSLPGLLAKTRDPQAGYALVKKLAADWPQLPEAQFAQAQVRALVGRFDEALPAIDAAERLRPDWQPAALLKAQLLARTSRNDALAHLKRFVARYPEAHDARLGYARMLVGANLVTEARDQFLLLTRALPDHAEVHLSAGLLVLQTGDAAGAEKLLERTLEINPKDASVVHYYLGLAAEEQKQPERARGHYEKVGPGNYEIQARSRQASLLAGAGKLAEARALLAATEGRNDEDRIKLVQAESGMLRDARDYPAAYQVLSDALGKWPDSTILLYDRAMAAEKVDKLDVLEADLKRLIELKPDDAQAYNALGYTLADRTGRLKEAEALLDKALTLAPEDPFILDSMGWAQYRLGNLARAQELVERAYKARPDPEIAAHLGEILWARGLQKEAATLWQTAAQTHPQNELLQKTMQRFPR